MSLKPKSMSRKRHRDTIRIHLDTFYKTRPAAEVGAAEWRRKNKRKASFLRAIIYRSPPPGRSGFEGWRVVFTNKHAL